ncbi:MAG: AMP-binding protein, partial [Cyanobacteria bacterium J06628_3]
ATVKPLELNGLTVERDSYEQEFVKYELRLNLQDTETGISGQVEYSSDLFDEETISRLVEHFRVLLEGIVENPDCQIGYLPLLSEAESKQILWDWNQTQRDYENKLCIHELFEIQVEKTPDAIALVHNNCNLTYRELNNRANQLAHYLQELGVKPESKVGVYLERNLELVIGILGILKAGAAYVPLDPAYPIARTEYIIEDAQIEVLLTQNSETSPPTPLLIKERGDGDDLISSISKEGVKDAFSPLLDKERGVRQDGVRLFNNWEKITQYSTDNPESEVKPDNLGYLIYTSGSTGKPKGVMLNQSTVTLLHWAREVFNDEVIAGMLASTSICFDLSVFELFVPLSWGGKIILVENVLELVDLPQASQVTAINTVPSAISQLSRLNAIPNLVNTINLAGEALQWNLVKQLEQKHPHIQQIFNLYGPSEDTTYSTYALVGG